LFALILVNFGRKFLYQKPDKSLLIFDKNLLIFYWDWRNWRKISILWVFEKIKNETRFILNFGKFQNL